MPPRGPSPRMQQRRYNDIARQLEHAAMTSRADDKAKRATHASDGNDTPLCHHPEAQSMNCPEANCAEHREFIDCHECLSLLGAVTPALDVRVSGCRNYRQGATYP